MQLALHPSLTSAAAPDTNYENSPPRRRYVVFSKRNSGREVELSCSITPGPLEERYSVEWQASTKSGFTTLEGSKGEYNFSVTVNSSSQPTYQCIVTIEHRREPTIIIIQDYDGQEIIVDKLGAVVVLAQ